MAAVWKSNSNLIKCKLIIILNTLFSPVCKSILITLVLDFSSDCFDFLFTLFHHSYPLILVLD